MSSDFAIRVRGLSKCFQIYDHPRDRLKQAILPRVRRALGMSARSYHREFWALREVDFEIRRGETLGVIGRNGSGKSTLLQLLCGTLTPTHGQIEVNGKVAALLELGAGFNPEFSGRENVFLSASFYGLSREETASRLADIVAFADIGDHLDQPVKTYSSGMFVRLAFAVIAHVDADILVIDEALSVGDAVFTQKCMRFIRDFQKRGTLLFVSHDMASVINLCRSAIWLNAGEMRQIGKSKAVADAYLQGTLQEVYGDTAVLEAIGGAKSAAAAEDRASETEEAAPSPSASLARAGSEASGSVLDYGAVATVANNAVSAEGWSSGGAEILGVTFAPLADGRESAAILQGGETVRLAVRVHAKKSLEHAAIGFVLRDRLGQVLLGENTLPFTVVEPVHVNAGEIFEAEFIFRMPMLPNGQYAITASVAEGDLINNVQHHMLHDALIVNVSSSTVRWGLVGVPFEKVSLIIK